MRNLEDLTGRQFGRLTVLGEAERDMGRDVHGFASAPMEIPLLLLHIN